MSATPRFIADLHLGHKKILHFSGDYREGATTNEHDDWIVSQWNSAVGKRDPVYILGDLAFSRDGLERVRELRGQKFLLQGNHDLFPIADYEAVGLKVIGFRKYKGFWLSHAPIHPAELRDCKNIHGHVHSKSIKSGLDNGILDRRYINVSVEMNAAKPVSISDIQDRVL